MTVYTPTPVHLQYLKKVYVRKLMTCFNQRLSKTNFFLGILSLSYQK